MRPAEAAITVLTAHRTKAKDTAGCAATVAAVIAEIGTADLLAAEVELAGNLLDGIEAITNRILSDRELLRRAFLAVYVGKPLNAVDIRADAASVLARMGTFNAAQEGT